MQQYAFPDDSAWSRCLAQFLKTCSPSGSAKTQREYRITLTYFLSHPAKMPSDYTQEDVHTFIYAPSRSPRNPGTMPSIATVNVRLAILKSWYSFAAAYTVEGADGHPTPLLKAVPPTFGMKAGRPQVEYRYLSFEEIEKLFAIIPNDTVIGLRDRAMFLCYFWTARRRNEIARLTWGDIERAILIDEHEQRREGWVYRFQGKGHAAKDDLAELPLPAKLAIDKYLVASGRMDTIKASDPLFVGTQFNQSSQLTDTSIARRLKYWARIAGLDTSRISLHTWRHTAARIRRAAGEDIFSLQRLLRHASLQTTYLYLRQLTSTADLGAKLLEAKYGQL